MSAAARFTHVLQWLSSNDAAGPSLPDRLCWAALAVLPVDSALLSVALGAGVWVPVGASDVQAALAEQVEFTVGEGPSTDSYTSRRRVQVADIGTTGSQGWNRWPTYTAELLARTSYRAVFAFPLMAENSVMGALNLYRSAPGPAGDVEDIVALTSLMSTHLLGEQRGSDQRWLEGPLALRRFQVWRAQGLIMQANHITAEQALDLLRAAAYTQGSLVEDLAADILADRRAVPNLNAP